MKSKVTPRDIIIYTLCLAVILLTLIDSTFKLVGIKYDFWLMAGGVTGIILYIFAIHRVKFAWISIVLLFLLPKPLYLIRFLKLFFLNLKVFIKSVIENQYIAEVFTNYFINLVFIVLPIIILIFYFIVVVKKHSIPLIILGGALISVYYYIGLDNLTLNCNIFLIASLILYSYNNYSTMWSKWDYKNIKIERGYFLRVIITNLILVLLVNFGIKSLPINKEPISLSLFQSKILDRFENLQGKEEDALSQNAYQSKFSLSYTGYQQDARRLGGPVKNDYSLALRVRSSEDIGGVHLRGTIKDLYNRSLWDKSDNNTTKFKGELEVKDYNLPYKFKEMEIIHEGIKTTTAFNALYPFTLKSSYNYGFIDSDLETFNPKVIKTGKSYTVRFKEYKTDQNTLVDKTPDRIGKYDETYNKYLALPAGIPPRVYDLAEEITQKYSSPYMKASAIENYLRTNFPYSKETSILPEGRDFVDYFLFEEKKGSCSYYATALAVMTRMVDIPSRYVEGFVIPYTEDSEGYREILNSDAHAWVELYFEGAGWVTFDPTPGNSSSAYQFPVENEGTAETPTENTENNTDANNEKEEKDQKDVNPDDLDGTEGNTDTRTPWTMLVLYGLIGILGFCVMMFLTSLISYVSINVFIRSNKKIIDYSKHKMILFGKLTYIPYAGGETLREYLEVLAGKLQLSLEEYIIAYERTLYAKHKISRQEQDNIISTMLEARKKVIENVGRVRFYYFDYIDTLKFYLGGNTREK